MVKTKNPLAADFSTVFYSVLRLPHSFCFRQFKNALPNVSHRSYCSCCAFPLLLYRYFAWHNASAVISERRTVSVRAVECRSMRLLCLLHCTFCTWHDAKRTRASETAWQSGVERYLAGQCAQLYLPPLPPIRHKGHGKQTAKMQLGWVS